MLKIFLAKGCEINRMEAIRFEKFTLLIDGIHKSINKIKIDIAPNLGVKSVHVFWLYELLIHPEGLTATELAAVSMIDRSLVSREIAALKKSGYIKREQVGRGRGYNARITLTDEGAELAQRIIAEAQSVQNVVDEGISEGELVNFYVTLEKLNRNFANLAEQVSQEKKPSALQELHNSRLGFVIKQPLAD